jgi:hypothetical protein
MKKLLIGLVAATLLLSGLLLALLIPTHCPVNRMACERIEKGMTLTQVEQLLGGPPGDYRTRPIYRERASVISTVDYFGPGWPENDEACSIEAWTGNTGLANVWFSAGTVAGWAFYEELKPGPGPVETIRWRLERLKERWLP